MARLTIHNLVPSEEPFAIFIDEREVFWTEQEVPNRFHLRIEQKRLASQKEGVGEFYSKLAMLPIRGSVSFGKEALSADYAVWEADCDLYKSGELSIELVNNEGIVLFDVESDDITFWNVTSERKSKPKAKQRQLLMMLPFVLLICGGMVYLVIKIGESFAKSISIQSFSPTTRWGVRIIILMYAAFFMVGAGYFVYSLLEGLRPSRPRSEQKQLRKAKVAFAVTWVIAGLCLLVAIAMILLPVFFDIKNDILLLLFMCAPLVIGWAFISGKLQDRLKYTRGELAEAKTKLRKAELWMFGALGVVFLLEVVLVVIWGNRA